MTDIIFNYFSSRIRFGYYAAGDRLPSTREICNQFQVSALTVRTAFSQLQSRGFIQTAERKTATVIYRPEKSLENEYSDYFLSRKDGMDDICRFADVLFVPAASACFAKIDAASLKQIRSRLRRVKGHPAKQIIRFYADYLHALQNPLLLNLYWEIVRYIQFPYLHRPADFSGIDRQAEHHIKQILTLAETGRPELAVEEVRAFSQNVTQIFLQQLHDVLDRNGQAEQIPFRWQIYRDRPQLCYTLAAEIMWRIEWQIYPQGTFLPSCQTLADEYGVSLITVRRTIELLNSIHVTETLNGIGTKVIPIDNAALPNFNIPQIHKNMLLFLQAYQIFAITCKSAAIHTLSQLGEQHIQILEDQIQKNNQVRAPYLLGETCLRFIGKHNPSPLIREVYEQLCRLLLWGNALHVFYYKSEKSTFYEAYSNQMQAKLQLLDIQGFAEILSDLVSFGVQATKAILLQLDFKKSELI